MSVRLMGAVFDLDVPGPEKLVLLAMADHARDDGTGCYPSMDTLARKTSQSRRGVQKIMRRLEQKGLIKPSKLSRGRVTTEYEITITNREPGSLLPISQPRTAGHPTANGSAFNREPGSPEPKQNRKEPKAAAKQGAFNPNPEDVVWDFLKIHPCGPISFRTLLESRWSARNGEPRSVLIGETVDAWEAAEGEKLRRAAPLFQALDKLRKTEKQASRPAVELSAPIHTFSPEEIPV